LLSSTNQKSRAQQIADILATAKTDEEQRSMLQALDAKNSVVQKKKESAPEKKVTAAPKAEAPKTEAPKATESAKAEAAQNEAINQSKEAFSDEYTAQRVGDILASSATLEEQDAQIRDLKPLSPSLMAKTGANFESTMTATQLQKMY
jgi:hypothetical protein